MTPRPRAQQHDARPRPPRRRPRATSERRRCFAVHATRHYCPCMRVAIVSDIHGNRRPSRRCSTTSAASSATRSGASATSSATAPTRTPASSSPAGTRRSAWPATTTSPSRRPAARRVLARRGPRGAMDAGDDQRRQPRATWASSSPPTSHAGRRPLPRQPARPGLGVRALRAPGRRAVPRRPAPPRLPDRPLPRRAVLRARRGRPRPGETRGAGDELDISSGRVAAQPGLASASRATATRAPPGCCSTPTSGWPAGGAPSTTSRGAAAAIRAAPPARLAGRAPAVRAVSPSRAF